MKRIYSSVQHLPSSAALQNLVPSVAIQSLPQQILGQAINSIEAGDYAASTATTAVLNLGVSEYATINSTSDEDWFRVDLVAGQTYEFRLLGVGANFNSDPLIRIRDSSGLQLAVDDDVFTSNSSTHELDSRLTFTATTSGTYYIEADSYNTSVGSYLLTGVTQNPSGMEFTVDEIAWQLTNNGDAFFGRPESATFNVGADGQITVNITALTAQGQVLALAALQTWSDLTGIEFVQSSGASEITFDDSEAGLTAYSSSTTSGTQIVSSFVMVTTGWLDAFGASFNSYGYETYIHEIGHALGLGHGGNYNGSATYGVDNFYLNDSLAYSIMSYMNAIGDDISDPNTFVGADFRYMLTPVIADFVAIERLYGSSTNTRTGNTTYGFNSNTGNAQLDIAVTYGSDVNFMVHDDGGTDTLDFSGSSAAQTLNLTADTLSSVLGGVYNMSISRGTIIEHAIGGSASDVITGNDATNYLYGRAGDDILIGGDGADQLYGGLGADQHIGGSNGNTRDFARYNDANYGDLTIRLDGGANVGAAAVGDTYIGIEGLSGGAGNDTVIGNNEGNTLIGGNGNDYIDGLGSRDILNGGAGADKFVFSTAFGANNIDIVQTFATGIDDIVLFQSIFSAIGTTLDASEFRIGAAIDGDDYIRYNSTTGALIYDSNGNAAGGAIQFATLSAGLALSVNDFMMV